MTGTLHPIESVRPAAGWSGRHWMVPVYCYAVLVALVLACYPATAVSLVSVWWSTPTFTHGFLVFPAAVAMIWMRRRELAAIQLRREPLALLPLSATSILWLIGEAGGLLIFQHAALAGFLVWLAVALLGRNFARLCWFPLVFLGFMVPAGEQLVPVLQDVTATLAVAMLGLTGIPVLHDGVLIQTPSGLFEVAEACAGIRFLIANIVVGSVFAYLSFAVWWKAALFMALSMAIPVIANGIRGFGIILIAHWTDNEYAAGVDHLVYGWGFFAFVMLSSLYLGSLFADRRQAVAPPELSGCQKTAAIRPVFAALLALPVVAGPFYAGVMMSGQSWEAPSHLASPRIDLPWQPVPDTGLPWRPHFRNATAEIRQTYSDGQQTVRFYLAFYAMQGQGSEVVHHGNQLADGQEWTRVATNRQRLTLDGGTLEVKSERMTALGKAYQTVAYWYWIDGAFTADPIEAKTWQIAAALSGRSQAAAVIALAVENGKTATFPGQTLQDYLKAMPDLSAYLQGLAASGDPEIEQSRN